MQKTKHSKSTSVFNMIKSLLFSSTQKCKKISENITLSQSENAQNINLSESLDEKPSIKLLKPVIESDILQCSYQLNQISLASYLKDQLFLGIIGNININDLKISDKSLEIIISKTSQINSLTHLRPYCFDFIISNQSNITLLKEIFKSNQRFLLKAKSDDQLKELIKNWETVIHREIVQKQFLLKKIMNKFLVSIKLVDNCYWVLLNQKHDNYIIQKIQKFGLKRENKNDQFVFQRMKQSLTFKEYMELVNLKKSKNRQLSKNQIYQFMIDHYLMTEQQFIAESPSKMTNQKLNGRFLNNITNLKRQTSYISSKGESLSFQNQTLKKISSFKFQSSDDENLFNLHLIDRYQDVQDQEQRRLSKDKGINIYKDKKLRHRTRSCSLQDYEGQSQLKLMIDNDHFLLDI